MATDFKYAAQSDLEMYYPAYNQFDSKRQVFGWVLGSPNVYDSGTLDIYYAGNTGLITQLYWNNTKVDKITYSSTAKTQIATAVEPDDTTFAVDAGLVFASLDIVKVNDEYIILSSVSTNDLITNPIGTYRGLFGTTNSHHAVDSNVYRIIDASSANLEATSKGDSLTFVYDSGLDLCILITDGLDPNDYVVEAGVDSDTYFDQMLVNASMELNNLLDRRYPTPIPKYTQYDANTAHVSSAPEYDAIIVKSTCYLCVANLLRANNRQEEADYYNNQVTNMEGSGLVDRLNKGEYKLSYEVDSDDSQGKVRSITKAGSMDIIETGGAYSGEAFDLLRITCTTGGAYGVAIVKVEYYGSDKLFGSEKTDIKVTGGLQSIHAGFYCRFQGSSMTADDLWEVEVYSETRKISNAESGAIQLTRRGYGI